MSSQRCACLERGLGLRKAGEGENCVKCFPEDAVASGPHQNVRSFINVKKDSATAVLISGGGRFLA